MALRRCGVGIVNNRRSFLRVLLTPVAAAFGGVKPFLKLHRKPRMIPVNDRTKEIIDAHNAAFISLLRIPRRFENNE